MLVQQILGSKAGKSVFTVLPGSSLSDAAAILSKRHIGALVVSEDGVIVAGILSERDIVRELGRRGVVCMTDRVDSIMTEKIVGCTEGETVDDVMRKMTEGRFRHLPVMKGDEMVGLISIGDVVKARLSELGMEKDALEGMIKGF